MKSGPGYGGQLAPVRIVIGIFGGVGIGRVVRLVVGFRRRHQLGLLPAIGAEIVVLRDGGLMVRAPYLNVLVFGNFQREDLCQDDEGARRGEILCSPELAWGLGLVDGDVDVVLQRVSGCQGAYRQVLFFQVAVERSLAGYGGRHVDRVGDWSVYGGAVLFVHAH
jgi:hypothetical protein